MVPSLIAVVDNDDAFLDLMRDALADAGYRVVVECASGAVIGMLARERPDLLILDLRIEETGSGMALLTALRQREATATLPILVCSADRQFLDGYLPEIHALGAEILAKPFNLDDLYTNVALMLARLVSPLSDGRAVSDARSE